MTTENYKTYDDGLFAQLYDQMIEQLDRGNKSMWEFFPRCAALFGDPILEMGCGTGLNLLPLAEMGYSIVGLDYSTAMLNVLEQKLAQRKPEVTQRVRLVEGDMVSPPIYNDKFRLIIFSHAQFLHLQTNEQRLACLKSTYNLLADDGIALICNPPLGVAGLWESLDEWREEPRHDEDEWFLWTQGSWHASSYQEKFKMVSKAQPHQEHIFSWSYYPLEDSAMQQLAQQAGLRSPLIPSDLPEMFHPRFKRCAFSK